MSEDTELRDRTEIEKLAKRFLDRHTAKFQSGNYTVLDDQNFEQELADIIANHSALVEREHSKAVRISYFEHGLKSQVNTLSLELNNPIQIHLDRKPGHYMIVERLTNQEGSE